MTFTFQDEEHVRRIVREEVKEEVKSQLTTFRSDLVSRLDKILKVTLDTQTEVSLLANKSTNHEDRLETIETRLNIVVS